MMMERRGLIELFPDLARVFFKHWQVRFLVVLSLSLQLALMLLGKVRKRNGKPLLRFSVWCAYLMADWVATVALGVISNKLQAEPDKNAALGNDLSSFWAPFLLLHLGGPDTITAYSLEDNELWQRRLLKLVAQTIVALYIFLIAWPGISHLPILSIPVLVAGFIKFWERISSLRSASTEQFRSSLMTEPDPGPNYSKFMEEFTLKKAEGFYVRADEIDETPLPTCVSMSVENDKLVLQAYDLFQTFKRLFVDLILSFQDREKSQSFFHSMDDPKTAFDVIEIELGFAYDVFYTKAPAVYNRKGHILRLVTFSATLVSLLMFIISSRRDKYHKIDLAITYLLLVAALTLDIYGFLILLFSDWSDYQLKKHYNKKYVSFFRGHLASRKRWSRLISQHSMLDFCRNSSSLFPWIQKLLVADNMLDKLQNIRYSKVSEHLKKLIFEQFMEISQSGNKSGLTALCSSRGTRVLDNNNCTDLNWSVTEVEFDQSILIWHLATELCFYSDGAENLDTKESLEGISKHMSDYLLYLLVMCPLMLPIGIGMIRFRDTCAEAHEFFKERTDISNKVEACRILLRVNSEIPSHKVKGDRSKSVLFDACRVATRLRAKGQTVKWKIISQVWVEILAYAACHCRGSHHARQLRKGGEFLTHVWLLMAHLGITEQFQISQGHARAKLSAK